MLSLEMTKNAEMIWKYLKASKSWHASKEWPGQNLSERGNPEKWVGCHSPFCLDPQCWVSIFGFVCLERKSCEFKALGSPKVVNLWSDPSPKLETPKSLSRASGSEEGLSLVLKSCTYQLISHGFVAQINFIWMVSISSGYEFRWT